MKLLVNRNISWIRLSSLQKGFLAFVTIIPVITIFTLYHQDSKPRTSEPGDYDVFHRRTIKDNHRSASPMSIPDLEELMSNKIIEMNERIKHAEMLNQERRKDILKLKSLIVKSSLTINGSANMSSHQDQQLHGSSSLGSLLQVPSLTSFLPHLLNYETRGEDPLKPAFRRVSSSLPPDRPSQATIVFGIPTVKRPVESYLLPTIANLIENMSPNEMKVTVIVIMIAETDMEFVEAQSGAIEDQYSEYIESGLIEVISPPASYYPDFNSTVKVTLGDPLNRVKWRTKQNLDFSYLMMYSQSKGTYYVQLEDDILSKPSFVTKMINYSFKQSNLHPDWIILDFCQLGFIGKMFKSTDLSLFSMFFLMFKNDKPVDWLLTDVLTTKLCSIDKTSKDCRKIVNGHWISFRPSLFQHIGTHSSLKGKVQKLKDKNFGKLQLFKPHKDNPSANCYTSLHHYKSFSIQNLYNGDSLFWSYSPSIHDHVTCDFTNPINLINYFIRSGNNEHPEDRFPINTTVEVLPYDKHLIINTIKDASSSIQSQPNPQISNNNNNLKSPSKNNVLNSTSSSEWDVSKLVKTDDGYYIIGLFKPNGMAEGSVPSELQPIKSIRINLRSDSQKWAMISEMSIRSQKG